MESSQQTLQLIPLPEVVRISGISRSEIFRRIHAGKFPQPVRIGRGRCTRWSSIEVVEWAVDRLGERDAKAAK